jgi:Na+-transporting NADH:ubiquinone oxidoreductase subunit C
LPEPSSVSVQPSNTRTIIFMVVLSLVCATILSLLASALAQPQELARDLYRSKQMLVAARILNPVGGYFQIRNEQGDYVPAKAESGGRLVPGTEQDIPTSSQLLDVYRARFVPYLADKEGKLHTFADLHIEQADYLAQHRKTGYYKQPYKLVIEIRPNPPTSEGVVKEAPADGYILPVNGFGLWGAVYGYLAIGPDANHVIGISWYEHIETPGLGANIAEPDWQSQFPGKQIFQANADGTVNFNSAPLGIIVVRGKVSEVYGDAPKAKSAVDGMAGATLTGNGITQAYQEVLEAYRPFLLRVQKETEKADGG